MTSGGATSFWTAADIVVALPVSWFPLAADYTRHVRGRRAAFVGACTGYGAATVAFFTLGVLALSAYGAAGLDVIGALLAVPLGLLAVLVLIVVELDEAFANIYSTAVSAQNVLTRVDRRLLAVAVGVVATVLALAVDLDRVRGVPVPHRGGLRAAGRGVPGRLLPAAAAPGTRRRRRRGGRRCCCRGRPGSWRTS